MTQAAMLRAGRDADAAGFIALIGECRAEYPGCGMDVDGECPELRALATWCAGQGGALWAAEAAGALAGMVATRQLDAAEQLYRALGWTEAGRIPGHALDAAGVPGDTVFFYRRLL